MALRVVVRDLKVWTRDVIDVDRLNLVFNRSQVVKSISIHLLRLLHMLLVLASKQIELVSEVKVLAVACIEHDRNGFVVVTRHSKVYVISKRGEFQKLLLFSERELVLVLDLREIHNEISTPLAGHLLEERAEVFLCESVLALKHHGSRLRVVTTLSGRHV